VLTVRHSMEHGGLCGAIDDLFVRPPFRRRGIGMALVEALVAAAHARGCVALQVEVDGANAEATALYCKRGLEAVADGRIILTGPLPPRT
jgi:GNAT superfamily N-acetyltransferase